MIHQGTWTTSSNGVSKCRRQQVAEIKGYKKIAHQLWGKTSSRGSQH